MKKYYSEPEMEVIGLGVEDMILTSGCDGDLPCDCDTVDYLPCDCHGKPGQEK